VVAVVIVLVVIAVVVVVFIIFVVVVVDEVAEQVKTPHQRLSFQRPQARRDLEPQHFHWIVALPPPHLTVRQLRLAT
jgi:predicted PurR-regulated permease PerM